MDDSSIKLHAPTVVSDCFESDLGDVFHNNKEKYSLLGTPGHKERYYEGYNLKKKSLMKMRIDKKDPKKMSSIKVKMYKKKNEMNSPSHVPLVVRKDEHKWLRNANTSSVSPILHRWGRIQTEDQETVKESEVEIEIPLIDKETYIRSEQRPSQFSGVSDSTALGVVTPDFELILCQNNNLARKKQNDKNCMIKEGTNEISPADFYGLIHYKERQLEQEKDYSPRSIADLPENVSYSDSVPRLSDRSYGDGKLQDTVIFKNEKSQKLAIKLNTQNIEMVLLEKNPEAQSTNISTDNHNDPYLHHEDVSPINFHNITCRSERDTHATNKENVHIIVGAIKSNDISSPVRLEGDNNKETKSFCKSSAPKVVRKLEPVQDITKLREKAPDGDFDASDKAQRGNFDQNKHVLNPIYNIIGACQSHDASSPKRLKVSNNKEAIVFCESLTPKLQNRRKTAKGKELELELKLESVRGSKSLLRDEAPDGDFKANDETSKSASCRDKNIWEQIVNDVYPNILHAHKEFFDIGSSDQIKSQEKSMTSSMGQLEGSVDVSAGNHITCSLDTVSNLIFEPASSSLEEDRCCSLVTLVKRHSNMILETTPVSSDKNRSNNNKEIIACPLDILLKRHSNMILETASSSSDVDRSINNKEDDTCPLGAFAKWDSPKALKTDLSSSDKNRSNNEKENSLDANFAEDKSTRQTNYNSLPLSGAVISINNKQDAAHHLCASAKWDSPKALKSDLSSLGKDRSNYDNEASLDANFAEDELIFEQKYNSTLPISKAHKKFYTEDSDPGVRSKISKLSYYRRHKHRRVKSDSLTKDEYLHYELDTIIHENYECKSYTNASKLEYKDLKKYDTAVKSSLMGYTMLEQKEIERTRVKEQDENSECRSFTNASKSEYKDLEHYDTTVKSSLMGYTMLEQKEIEHTRMKRSSKKLKYKNWASIRERQKKCCESNSVESLPISDMLSLESLNLNLEKNIIPKIDSFISKKDCSNDMDCIKELEVSEETSTESKPISDDA